MDKSRLKTPFLGGLLFLACLIVGISGSISHSIEFLKTLEVSPDIIYLPLILPFLGLFLAFSKIIIGMNTPNSYVPLTVVITSFFIGPLLSITTLIVCLIVGYFMKYIIVEFKLHSNVKTSLILSLLSIIFILLLPFYPSSLVFQGINYSLLICYGIFLISLINEKYLSFKITKSNLISDLKIIFSTILFSFITYLILGGKIVTGSQYFDFPYLKDLVMGLPEIVLVAILLTALIGRYTGLRLTELWRFRKLIFKNN